MFMYVEMRKYMKKKLFSVLLVGALAASLVACGKTEKKEAKASTANTEINAEEYAGTITSNAGVYKTFVNLSDWKGMSVDLKESDYVVLDSDVEDYIKSMLESKATTNEQLSQEMLLSLITVVSLTEQHFQEELLQTLLTQLVQENSLMILIRDLWDLQ